MSGAEAEERVKDNTVYPLEGTTVLDTQVGGHRYGSNGKKMGMLDRGNGIVLKAIQTPPRGTRELTLYQTIFAPSCKDKHLLELRNFLPMYYGTETVDDVTFLVMSNIVHTFPKPNVLDLKMGRVTYDPEATLEKRKNEESKYPPLTQLGFQFTGMMMHDSASGTVQHFSKQFCRSITADTMLREGLGKFFGLQKGNLRKDVLVALLHKLRRIEKWFLMQRTFAFYASSLLIVYSSIEQDCNSATSKLELEPRGNHPYTNDSACGSVSTREIHSSKSKDIAARTDQRPSHKRACSVDTEAETGTNPKQPKASPEMAEGQEVQGHGAETCTNSLQPKASPGKAEGEVGDQSAEEEQDRGLRMCKSDPPLVEVKMIDFAHAFPASGRDDNYLFGLQNLITFLEQLLKL